jgi:hypothetical protein
MSDGDEKYRLVAARIAEVQATMEPEERTELALTLIASLTATLVRAGMEIAVEKPELADEMMTHVGVSVALAVQEGYRAGSDGVCPCGECAPIEVNVLIEQAAPPLDPTPAPKGTVFN